MAETRSAAPAKAAFAASANLSLAGHDGDVDPASRHGLRPCARNAGLGVVAGGGVDGRRMPTRVFEGAAFHWFGRLVLFGFTLALVFHTLNGVRHLFWDVGLRLQGCRPRMRAVSASMC